MSKKRTSLDSLFSKAPATPPASSEPSPSVPKAKASRNHPGIKQQTAYLPDKVHEQLRRLAFEERARMHDYLMEGLDLVFRKRGLPSLDELLDTGKTKKHT